jgi:hypothetical protein
MHLEIPMEYLPYVFTGIAFVVGALLLSLMKFRRPRRDRELSRLETGIAEAISFEKIRSQLREVQLRLHALPPEILSRYENRVMKVLHEAARLGITVTPEKTLQGF